MAPPYTSGEWINKKDIPLSGWPINKKANNRARIKTAGVGKAKALLRKLDAPPARRCTHCQADLSKENTSGLCKVCWRLGRQRRAIANGYKNSTGTKQAAAVFDRVMCERLPQEGRS
jgi:hypothetical protein